MSEKSKPGYYAVIPAAVRYCDTIPASAKLLYGEISSLANGCGFCWATDQYFADLYSVNIRTVKNLLKALADGGFVLMEDKTVDGKKLRLITLNPAALIVTAENLSGTMEKIFQSQENNFQTLENFFHGIYCSNNKNNNPPIVPQGAQREPAEPKRTPPPDFEPERFGMFWDYYRSLVPAGVRIGGKAAAKAAWNNLRPDKTTKQAMFAALREEAATKSWQEGSGIKYVSTWLNAFARGDACETGTGGASDPGQPGTEVQQW